MPDFNLYHEIQKCKIAQNLHKICNNYYNNIEQEGKGATEKKKILTVIFLINLFLLYFIDYVITVVIF